MSAVGKVVIKSTTGISLNERFTQLRRVQAPQPSTSHQQPRSLALSRSPRGRPTTTSESLRQRQSAAQQASSKNKRLAQQMERRPAVAAALRLKKRSLGIASRVGTLTPSTPRRTPTSNVKSRLSLPARSRRPGSIRGRQAFLSPAAKLRGSIRTRVGSKRLLRFQQTPGARGNVSLSPRRGRARGTITRGRVFRSKSPRGVSHGGRSQEDFPVYQQFVQPQTPRGGRGRGGRGRGRGRGEVVPTVSTPPMRGARGSAMRNRGGRGRGRGLSGRGKPLTREELDNELDQYMSITNTEEDDITMQSLL